MNPHPPIPAGTFGFNPGAGAAVTQQTNKSTAVTIDAMCGQITMNSANLPANTAVSFVVNNALVETADVPVVVIDSVGTVNAYTAQVAAVGAGSFTISLREVSGSGRAQAVVLNFAIIKGAAS